LADKFAYGISIIAMTPFAGCVAAGKLQMEWLDLATHWSGLPTRPDNFPDPTAPDPYAGYTDDLFFEFMAHMCTSFLCLSSQKGGA
jgi:hypothetical protein